MYLSTYFSYEIEYIYVFSKTRIKDKMTRYNVLTPE
jgi:hypothetical protein